MKKEGRRGNSMHLGQVQPLFRMQITPWGKQLIANRAPQGPPFGNPRSQAWEGRLKI